MAKFIKSAKNITDWINDNVDEIAFIGRSNVGKSSLINALAKQKIAVTSKSPGRTQLANFYDFDKYRIIDLPGYGYAKVNKSKKIDLINIIDDVFNYRKNIFAFFQICDANVVTEEDVKIHKYLARKFANCYIVLNKTDKQPIKIYLSKLDKIAKYLNIDKEHIIFVSAKKNENIDVLRQTIKNLLNF